MNREHVSEGGKNRRETSEITRKEGQMPNICYPGIVSKYIKSGCITG